jgi:signal transduction histidine kinase
MMAFTIAIILFSNVLLLTLSSIVQKQKLDTEAQQYLGNAYAVANNIKEARLSEMRICAETMAANAEFLAKLEDSGYLTARLADLQLLLPNLDFLAVIQPATWQILAASHDLAGIPGCLIEMLADLQPQESAISGELVFSLTEIFRQDSPELLHYRVKIIDSDEYMQKCLTGVCIMPIRRQGRVEAYLLLADISNNDDTMPAYFTQSLENAYFSLAVDSVRVCSNVQDAIGTNYIGSYSPVSVKRGEQENEFSYGLVEVGDEIHVYLTGYVTDYNGDNIATLGVGMPQERFFAIMKINNRMIGLTGVITLFVIVIAGYFVTRKITAPINLSTEIAQQIARGERDITVDEKLLEGQHETARLLRALQEMAKSLSSMEKEIENVMGELLDNNDQLEETIAQRTDELWRMVGELEKSNKVKSQFLANMSHELRTPLSAVICSGKALLEGHFGPLKDKQAKYLENIIASGQHLLQIINDILDVSKIDAGMMKLEFSKFRFVDALENTLSTMHSLANRKKIEVHTVCPDSGCIINADEKRIRQILYNLLSNAIKFTLKEGKVWINVQEIDKMLRVSIKDNGVGIKKEDQERVFEAFEQADSSYAREYEGTGLGLPICRSLIQMHRGEIGLYSQEGVGTEVIFTIPMNRGE